jgi:hypothetical protein
VLAFKESLPTAVLQAPVVLANKAFKPTATLEAPVVLAQSAIITYCCVVVSCSIFRQSTSP